MLTTYTVKVERGETCFIEDIEDARDEVESFL